MTRYELLDRIGVGGMAEIFRGKAVAAGGFEKPVAIKRILPHLSQDTPLRRAADRRGQGAVGLLKHRNIVQIFDVGLGDDGQYFLVMEYVDGKDLGALQRGIEARRQRMPFDLVLHIGAEICEALEHAHSAKAPDGKPMSLVHRDVSPSNVLLSRAGEVKLTDFGIAKRAEEGTQTGTGVRGKFAYISPEQARNSPSTAAATCSRSALMMWELVTGRRLFSGLPDFDALRAVREDADRAGRAKSIRRCPPSSTRSCSRPWPSDPRKRLPSAGELGKRLRGLRYSLDTSTGDPAAALARLVPNVVVGPAALAAEAEANSTPVPPSAPKGKPGRRAKPTTGGFEVSTEPTFVRIRTADGFAHDPDGSGLLNARKLLDRFEEEETRLARLPRGMLEDDQTRDRERDRARRDSAEVTVTAPPPLHLDVEATGDGPPLHLDDSDHGKRPRLSPARPPGPPGRLARPAARPSRPRAAPPHPPSRARVARRLPHRRRRRRRRRPRPRPARRPASVAIRRRSSRRRRAVPIPRARRSSVAPPPATRPSPAAATTPAPAPPRPRRRSSICPAPGRRRLRRWPASRVATGGGGRSSSAPPSSRSCRS